LLVIFFSAGISPLKPLKVTDDSALQVGLLIQGLAAIGTTAAQCVANNLAYDETPANKAKFNQLKLLARLGKLTNDCAMLYNIVRLENSRMSDGSCGGVIALGLIASDLVNVCRDVDRIATFKYEPITPEQAEVAAQMLSTTGRSAAIKLTICASAELASNLAFIAHAALRASNSDLPRGSYSFQEKLLRGIEQGAIVNALILARIVPHIIDASVKKNVIKAILWCFALGGAAVTETALVTSIVAGHGSRAAGNGARARSTGRTDHGQSAGGNYYTNTCPHGFAHNSPMQCPFCYPSSSASGGRTGSGAAGGGARARSTGRTDYASAYAPSYQAQASYTQAPQPVRAAIDAIFNAQSGAEATRLYRALQGRVHPDKGGNVVDSQAVNAAWDLIKIKFGLE
jgi:hypothetical protein